MDDSEREAEIKKLLRSRGPIADIGIRRGDDELPVELIELRKKRLRAGRVARKNRRRAAREGRR